MSPQERALPDGRARTLALGTGLTSAVYLPLLLHSALPDSTMPFAALALGACLLMTRIARDPRGARLTDPRLLGLGLLLGLTALTRNEAVWLALTWVVVAWLDPWRQRRRAGAARRPWPASSRWSCSRRGWPATWTPSAARCPARPSPTPSP